MIVYRNLLLAIGLSQVVASSALCQTQSPSTAIRPSSQQYDAFSRSIRLSAMKRSTTTPPDDDLESAARKRSPASAGNITNSFGRPIQLSRFGPPSVLSQPSVMQPDVSEQELGSVGSQPVTDPPIGSQPTIEQANGVRPIFAPPGYMPPRIAQPITNQRLYSKPQVNRQEASPPIAAQLNPQPAVAKQAVPALAMAPRSMTPPPNITQPTVNPSNIVQAQYSQRAVRRPEASRPIASPPYVAPPFTTQRNVAPRGVDPSIPSQSVAAQHTYPQTNQTAIRQPPADPPMQPPVAVSEARTQLDRPKIIFDPVMAAVDGRGNSVLRPDVQVPQGLTSENLPSLRLAQYHEHQSLPIPPQKKAAAPKQPAPQPSLVEHMDSDYSNYVVAEDETLPPARAPAPDGTEGDFDGPYAELMMQPGCAEPCSPYLNSHPDSEVMACWYGLFANLHGPRAYPAGIGPENVMNAPFFIDTTQPLNNCRIRGDAGKNWEFPDRAEYFWAKTPNGLGPQAELDEGEPDVDYQDISFYIERGTDRFSVGTELPIRSVDPEIRLNTTGFADMNLTTKALLLDGKCWQLTQVFRTFFPTGSAHRGTGNGHFSLEPGIAARYKFSDITYFHGDLSYWFPLGGDLDQAGQILNAGLGISHVLVDTDTYAVIPTLELVSSTVLDGAQTNPGFVPVPPPMPPPNPNPFVTQIDSLSVVNLHPGVRIVCDRDCDCGTKEFGIAGGIALTEDHWFESMIRLEFRWTY